MPVRLHLGEEEGIKTEVGEGKKISKKTETSTIEWVTPRPSVDRG